MMKLYNSLTRTLSNLDQPEVNIYSCGATVYNYIHIGNARPLITVDLLINYLEFNNVKVNFLQNYTDIDDKIINQALGDQKTEKEVSEFFIAAFQEDITRLQVRKADLYVPISMHIEDIINFIAALVDKGAAYAVEGNVYFAIDKYETEYGYLSNKVISELTSGARIEVDPAKRNPLDFTLWKKTTTGILFDSPWGKGRPGWHTECALLIDLYFNHQTINIHMGGIDLIFPHHENERIQYLAKNQKEIADIWLHNGHLNLDNEKMSKSLGNIIPLRQYLDEYGSNSLKYLMYSTNYAQPLNITDDLIQYAINEINKIFNLLKNLNRYLGQHNLHLKLKERGANLTLANDHLANNLNTPNVLTLVNNLMKTLNHQLKENNLDLIMTSDFYNIIFNLLNFNFVLPKITPEVIKLLEQWETYKKEKEYDKADQIRSQLIQKDII